MLTTIDWLVIAGYLVGMLTLGWWLGRRQAKGRDYYLGGNQTGPLPIAISTMATQASTNSLLGAPAFVAFAGAGGLLWLQYELAVPLAMAVLLLLLMPVLRSLQLVSIYAYLEDRFGLPTRLVTSGLFQFFRAFSTGVTVYGISLVVQVCAGVPFMWAVLMLGGITIVYDVLGGMRAVIWSDVIQMIILLGAVILVLFVGLEIIGGWGALGANVAEARLQTLDFSGHGFGDGAVFAFWPMLFGGLFLYVAYYGVDQTQAQRVLSTRSVRDVRATLFLGGLLRFPFVLLYCLAGVVLAAYAVEHPEFLQQLVIPELIRPGEAPDKAAYNVALPLFVIKEFPAGLVGLVMVGLFAAAMSSLDSTINSLSAVTTEDYVLRLRKEPMSERGQLWLSRGLTCFWGVVTLAFAFVVGNVADTIIEAINKISSLINGPLLALFMMGLFTKRVGQAAALAGLMAGFFLNLYLWRYQPGVSWLWYNALGFALSMSVGLVVARFLPRKAAGKATEVPSIPRGAWVLAGILGLYFVLMLGSLVLLPRVF